MKKILYAIIVLLCSTLTAHADGLVVGSVGIQPGKTATVQVSLSSTGESYRAVLFSLSLPEGISVVVDEFGDPATTAAPLLVSAGYNVTANHLGDGSDRFAVVNTGGSNVIPAECGPLFSFTVMADESLEAGRTLTGTLSDIKLTDAYAEDHPASDVSLSITVEELRTILDETSTTAPVAATGVNVRVKRTVKANEWSTICLPFDMTEAQTKAAFGEDVQIADFNGYDVEEDGDGNIVGIAVKFVTGITAIEANHPYIIKVSGTVSGFTVDGVDIDPEEDPMVNKGTRRRPKAIVGTYTAGTIENGNLFLNANKFWYSTGGIRIKAFRAYFNFDDLLTYFEENYAEARITMTFDDDATGISLSQAAKGKGSVYALDGRKVGSHLSKGLYVRDGKKVVVK
jgi:hypothetical protein